MLQMDKSSAPSNPLAGFGGQIDFIRGAALSLDGEGKPIIACTSTTDDGISRIVPTLKEGKEYAVNFFYFLYRFKTLLNFFRINIVCNMFSI